MGGSGSGNGYGTIFSRDIGDLCVGQRSQFRGYKDCLPHGSSFSSTIFIGTIFILFCYVNIKLILCRLASYACIVIWVAFVFIAVLAL